MNATFIALIPKEAQPNTPDKYRLIALCNIIYKIVSKIIASRLKLVLPLIISSEKYGYVNGRQITDGIILTHEIIHSLKKLKKPEQAQKTLDTELMKRKIQCLEEKDILRWGYKEKGTFSTKESYNIIIKKFMVKDNLWSKLWDPTNWPKVSTFLWLLCHNKILTWDNLRKRNYHGPSICPNCRQEEESIKHLMQSCTIACKLWEKVSFRCQKEGRIHGDVIAIVRCWDQKPFKIKILNFLWKLIPGFLMWTIWEERN
eukprot:PITA_19008